MITKEDINAEKLFFKEELISFKEKLKEENKERFCRFSKHL